MDIVAPLAAYGAIKALDNFLGCLSSSKTLSFGLSIQGEHGRPGGVKTLIVSSIVATDMAQIAFESLKGIVDFDFEAQAMSVEQSCRDILRISG